MVLSLKNTWGVASLRLCSGYPVGENNYIAPLCSVLVDWNVISKDCKKRYCHSDLITVFIKNIEGISLSVSFHGDARLWNSDLTQLSSFSLPSYYVIHGNWSVDGILFGICTKGPKQMLIVYDLHQIFQQQAEPKWTFEAPQEVPNNTESFDCFNACLFKQNGNVLAIYQSERSCKIFEFTSTDGKLLKKVNVSPLNDNVNIMLCISSIHNNVFAVGLQNGIFAFYDSETLEFKNVIQASGSPQVCLWHDDLFLTASYSNGILGVWDTEGRLLHEVKDIPNGSIVHMDRSLTSTHSYWIGGIMSLNYITLSEDKKKVSTKHEVSFLKLTGCGISVNDQATVAAGDFTGNIMLWNVSHDQPIKTNRINSSVRCLEWFNDVLLIGSLDSTLYAWYTNSTSKNIVELPAGFLGGVTIAKLSKDKKHLAVGTTGGHLYVYTIAMKDSNVKLDLLYDKLQHKPKKSPDGTMIPMEIWSLCWSPDDTYIVTTSEDQTSAISKSNQGDVIKSLSGHTTAVTSVDWKILSNKKCYLITCADDKTARIYDGVTFDYLRSVNTYDVYGWHTLTYMCINEDKDLLICCTQNGYLVSWDLKTFECVYKKKQHAGSIEGLVLDGSNKHIFTVGSDCVVNAFRFD